MVAPQGWQGYLLDPLLALGAQVPGGVIVLPKWIGDLISHEYQMLLLDAECRALGLHGRLGHQAMWQHMTSSMKPSQLASLSSSKHTTGLT